MLEIIESHPQLLSGLKEKMKVKSQMHWLTLKFEDQELELEFISLYRLLLLFHD